MASIQKVINKKGVSYRVYIRRIGLSNINKTFQHKKKARLFSLKIEESGHYHKSFSSKMTFNELVEDYLSNLDDIERQELEEQEVEVIK